MEKNNKGFTLIELLAVVIILGIVSTISVQTYNTLILNNDESKYKYYLDFIKKGVDLYTDAKRASMLDNECLSVDYQTLVDKNYLKEEDITCTGNIILRKEDNKYTYDDTNLECSTKKSKIVKEKGETEAICNVTLQFTFDNNYERVSNIAKDMNALTDNWKDLNTTHTVISFYDLKDAKQMSFTENLSESGIYQELTEPIIYGKTYTWSVYIRANNTHRFKIGLGSGTKEIQATGDWQKVTHTFEATKEDVEVKEFKIVSTTGWQGTNDDLYLHSTEFLKVSKPLKTKYAKVIGKTFESLPQVTRKGYELVGWFTEKTGGEQITESTIVPNKKNITYYAHWKKKDLKVNYLANGGVGTTTTDTITYGDNYTIKDNTFTKVGYGFNSWLNQDNDNFNIWPNTLITWDYSEDTNLSANWLANTYTITYNGNGNTGGSTSISTHSYDEDKTLTANGFAKTGHTFSKWNTVSNGTGTSYNDQQSVKNLTDVNGGNINLFAQWTANKYTVSFNGNGGSTPGAITVTYGGTYAGLPSSSRSGYDFKGWYNGSTKITASSTVSTASNHTLTAKWEKEESNCTDSMSRSFNYDGSGSHTENDGSGNACGKTKYSVSLTIENNKGCTTKVYLNGDVIASSSSDGDSGSGSFSGTINNVKSVTTGSGKCYVKWKVTFK